MANPHLLDCLEAFNRLDHIATPSWEIKQLEKLKAYLLAGTQVLADADRKADDVEGVKRWLTKFQDASFKAENILEVLSMIPLLARKHWTWNTNFAQEEEKKMHDMAHEKIPGVLALLEHLVGQIKVLGLREAQRMPRSHMTRLLSNDRYLGREADKLALTNLLLSSDIVPCGTPSVISVNGMPGIGKTALVQVVYNDESLARYFDLKVWICVGQDFDVFRVTKDVLQKITSVAANTEYLPSLQDQLMETLAGKRFLLVLDDFWSESSSEWKLFLSAFTGASEGSKIVITTQNDIVASITQAAQTYQLKLMTDTECWELIRSSVLENKSVSSIDQEKERVGKKIAEQCKGLPLAATFIASHLQSKPDLSEWEVVSSNFLHYTTSVLEVLRRSYDSLPCHLKRCFAFCSIFPKGYEVDRKNLVLLWMAADLLYQPGTESNQRLEDIGNKYLDDLVARSFLQSVDSKKRFTMHDLMNDLAKTVAVDFCYRLEDESLVQQIPKRVRHISFCGKQWDSSVASTLTRGAKYLRTFLPLVVSPFGCSKLVEKALEPLPDFSEQTLRCLRILSLSHYHITRLPESFKGLMTLRYLDLSNTEVIEIPAFVMGLHNLQTLFLSNCRQLRRLTASIVDLINLRYLVLLRTPLVQMPLGISKLTSLQNLSNFVVGNLNGASLEELRELSHLQGTLHISELQNVVTLEEASAACLREKPLLKKLVLTWDMEISGRNTIACEQSGLLQMLQPHHNLKKVSINSYGGATFPKWLGHTSFTSMTSVSLTKCSLCVFLPSLGQLPKLKYLSIENFKILQKVGLDFYYGEKDNVSTLEPFPCLEDLSFYDMPRWEEWRFPELEGRIFPRLDKLTIKSCPRLTKKFLKELPDSTKVDYDAISDPYLPRNKELHKENKELCRPEPESSSRNNEDIFGASSSDAAASTYGKMMPQADDDETGFESTKVTKVPQLKKVSASIKRLHIEGCLREKYLPESLLQDCPSLQELLVVSCHSLEALPGEYPSTTLKTLYIRDCMKLEFLETVQTNLIFPQLEDLFIDSSCSNLQQFRFASFQNLRSLSLRHCEKLSGFTVGRHDGRLALESLEIMDCPMLKLFPSGVGTLKLTSLLISNCGNLKKLPPDLKEFTSLLSIHINECPEVEHVAFYDSGTYYGFSESLQTLCINFCTKLRPMAWKLNALPNLRDLQIKGGNDDVKSFPPHENLLPWGLNSLRISDFKNLRTLNDKGLKTLRILRMLEISGCDKLESLPDEGLPSSLSLLRINGCPILKEKIYRKKFEWFKIKHIQLVVIDGEKLMR